MHPENKEKLERRIIQAAHVTMGEQKYVSAIDILIRVGWLMPNSVKEWRLGRVDYLERRIQANLKKISYVMKFFRKWALEQGLKPSQTVYLMRTKGSRQELRFSKSGDPTIETTYRTHYISPELSETKQAKILGKLNQSLCSGVGDRHR